MFTDNSDVARSANRHQLRVCITKSKRNHVENLTMFAMPAGGLIFFRSRGYRYSDVAGHVSGRSHEKFNEILDV